MSVVVALLGRLRLQKAPEVGGAGTVVAVIDCLANSGMSCVCIIEQVTQCGDHESVVGIPAGSVEPLLVSIHYVKNVRL